MSLRRGHWCAVLAVSACLTNDALAAEFSKSSLGSGRPDFIEVRGDLALGDERKFIDVALSSESAVVVFQSPGGNLFAGIEIGKAIRLKGFATLVPETMQCASACALAWLGGRVRYMSAGSRVGFHAAFISQEGQSRVSSAGNAVVGAYLNQLGLPTSAVVYLTDTAPEKVQWLSFDDAQRHGIEVKSFNLAGGSPERRERPRADPKPAATTAAPITSELLSLFEATNRSNDEALAYLQAKYADHLNYFGKTVSRTDALRDKRSFFRRWPTRRYVVQADSLKVDCSSARLCTSEGVLEWDASGPSGMTSSGTASFAYNWVFEAGSWKISAETSRVISRDPPRR